MAITSSAPCVVSVAEHAGWAHLLCVAADAGLPRVVDRRRVAVIEPGVPTQPYHHDSLGLPIAAADTLIARVRQSIDRCTASALEEVTRAVMPRYLPVVLAIRESPFPRLPDTVAEVRPSYVLQCAADGMLYQQAMCRAARDRGLIPFVYPRGRETDLAAQALGVSADAIAAFVSDGGRPPGPPWTQEHRRAYAAGIAALAGQLPQRLRISSSPRGSRYRDHPAPRS